MKTTKSEILNCIQELTQDIDFDDVSSFSASSISEYLSISRSLASQYLNELLREGHLLKVVSRPVLFFHKDLIKYTNNYEDTPREYLTLDELKKDINLSLTDKLSSDIVGAHESLKTIINNSKASVGYPPTGLPLLLNGKYGVGKTLIVHSIFEYAIGKGYIGFNKKIQNISSRSSDFIQLLNEAIDEKRVGMIYIFNLENLSTEDQEELSLRIKNDEIKKHLFLSTEDKSKVNSSILLEMSYVMDVSDYLSRSVKEREQLVISFFKEEEKTLNVSFLITRSLVESLVNKKFEGEIDGLRKAIRNIAAKSAFETQEKEVRVLNYHVQDILKTKVDFDQEYLTLEQYSNNFNLDTLYESVKSFEKENTSKYYEYLDQNLKVDERDRNVLQDILSKMSEMDISKNVSSFIQSYSEELLLIKTLYTQELEYIEKWTILNGITISKDTELEHKEVIEVVRHMYLNTYGIKLLNMELKIILSDFIRYSDNSIKVIE